MSRQFETIEWISLWEEKPPLRHIVYLTIVGDGGNYVIEAALKEDGWFYSVATDRIIRGRQRILAWAEKLKGFEQ